MKEMQATTSSDSSESALPMASPKGIGMAVAFDWAFGAQFLVAPLLAQFFGITGFGAMPGAANTPMAHVVMFIVTLPVLIISVLFGEGVRRGWRWTRIVQVVINTLLFLGGIVSLYTLWQAIMQGHYWPIITTCVLLFICPVIAWRMSRPETKRWFATVTSTEARQRHGGMWPVYIALWALLGSTLVVLAMSLR